MTATGFARGLAAVANRHIQDTKQAVANQASDLLIETKSDVEQQDWCARFRTTADAIAAVPARGSQMLIIRVAKLLLVTGGCSVVALTAQAAVAQVPEDNSRASSRSTPASDAKPASIPAPPAGNGEIVVTAQRREQSIQKVGISITAISGDMLAKLGVQTTQDIAAHVPGLQFDSGSGGGVNAFVTIRGVTQVDPAEHQEAPNAVYLDEVYVPTTSMVGFPLYDVARAEALRGPQGTLFGRNSTGGLLQFVTTDPSPGFKGYVDANYGSYNLYRVEGGLGGPIIDGLDFRVAGLATQGDGWFRNRLAGNSASFATKTYGVRGKLRARLGSDWQVMLTGSLNTEPRHHEGAYKASVAYVDQNGTTQYLPANVDFYGTGPGNDPYGYRDPSADPFSAEFNSDEGQLSKKFDYADLKVTGPVAPGITLTSISNYSYGRVNYSEDTDSTPQIINTFGNAGRTKQLSQELKINGQARSLNWTAGLYYLDLRGDYSISFALPVDNYSVENIYAQNTRSYAAYAQVEYWLTKELKMTLGARYTHDRKTMDSSIFDLSSGSPALIYQFNRSTVGSLARLDHGDFTGKAQLDYQPNNDLLLYAGVSRGYRGGGFNASPDGSIRGTAVPFKPETVIDYEGGAKLRFFDGKASLRAGVFYYDYRKFQAFNFINTVGATGNNNADFYGGEVELTARPARGFDVSLGASTIHGKIKDFVTPLGAVIDAEPLKAPRLSINGIVGKEFSLGRFVLRAQYDFDYQSRSEANLVPSPVTSLPGSFMQNARISIGRPDLGWEWYAFVHNLGNIARKSYGYDLSYIGLALASYDPPRTFGIGVRKTF